MRCAHCDALNPDDAGLCLDCRQPPLLDGRYRFDDRIGRGANGTVYRATDFQTGATVAVKELPLRADLDPKRRQLFEREAATLAQLDHPAIPRLHGQLIAGRGKARSLYLMQDYVEGTSLTAEQERRRYTEDDVLGIMDEVLGILGYLHGLSPPVIHRDLKPSNLMRRPDGSLALIDFGAVREALRDPDLGGSTVAGTFGYMAPEQFTGDAVPATDIYGLGATAVALLSRKDPAALHDRRGDFRWQRAVKLSDPTAALLDRMLCADPDQRPHDAAALRQEIARIRAGEVATPPPRALAPNPAPTRLAEPRGDAVFGEDGPDQPLQRREPGTVPAIRALLFIVVVTLSAAGTFAFLLLRPDPPAPPIPAPPVVEQIAAPSMAPAPTAPIPEGLREVSAEELTITNQVDPPVPVAELEALGVTEVTCELALVIQPHGTTDLLGVTDGSSGCTGPIYDAIAPSVRRWNFNPADRDGITEPVLFKPRVRLVLN